MTDSQEFRTGTRKHRDPRSSIRLFCIIEVRDSPKGAYGGRGTGRIAQFVEESSFVRHGNLGLCSGLPNVPAWRILGFNSKKDCDQPRRVFGYGSQERCLVLADSGGHLTALTFVLRLGSKERFGRSRDVGCYLGLRPKSVRRSRSSARHHPWRQRISLKSADRVLRPRPMKEKTKNKPLTPGPCS